MKPSKVLVNLIISLTIAGLCLWFTLGVAFASGPVIIIDNTDPEFSLMGALWISDDSLSGYQGDDYYVELDTDSNSDHWAQWQPVITQAGYYSVYLRWVSDVSDANIDAQIIIKHGGSVEARGVDQYKPGIPDWAFVGIYDLPAGNDNFIRLLATGLGMTVADAVMLVYEAPPAPAPAQTDQIDAMHAITYSLPTTGDSVLYERSISAGQVIIAAPLWAILIVAAFFIVRQAAKGMM